MYVLGWIVWFDANGMKENDPFIQASKRTPVDLEAWATAMMEKQKRNSHLISQPVDVSTNMLNGGKTPTADINQRMAAMNITNGSRGKVPPVPNKNAPSF